jgi:hypothetical protein
MPSRYSDGLRAGRTGVDSRHVQVSSVFQSTYTFHHCYLTYETEHRNMSDCFVLKSVHLQAYSEFCLLGYNNI